MTFNIAYQPKWNDTPEKVPNCIVGFMRDKANKEQKWGILLGLSGGIDSVVVVAILAETANPHEYPVH